MCLFCSLNKMAIPRCFQDGTTYFSQLLVMNFCLEAFPKESRQHKTECAVFTSSLFHLWQSDMWERTPIPLQRVTGTERILTQTERSHTCFWLQGWGHILQNIFPNMLQDNWNWQVKKCENEKEITSSEEHIPLCLDTLPMDLLCGAQDYSVCITSRIFSVMSEALTQAG